MRITAFLVCITLAALAVAACKNTPTGPTASSPGLSSTGTASIEKGATIKVEDLLGTWRATKAEVGRSPEPGALTGRRELVSEGGTITLVLEGGQMQDPANWPRYSITITLPGVSPGVDTGRWIYHEFWGKPQIDFYPSSIPDPEYGEIPAFLVSLNDNTLSLWDSGLGFLPFDFGWKNRLETVLNLVFTRM